MNKKVLFSFIVASLLFTGCAKEEKYISLEERGMKTSAKEANSKEGSISTSNKSENKDKKDSNSEEKQKNAVISVETANFRKEASKDGELISSLNKDQKVKLLSTETVEGTKWAKIDVDGQEGYTLYSFLNIEE
ncbi:SH3 domain-containing protein [Peptostreptococcus equinus]|uniref:SH3 domain-containing protein n=1 Tax=Peptostreptococcus equinus TaxID=3003601 RepID=A0ABY7JLY0_9FIRM|nr:SH3 domain-containing protein [Peptostreptococcus sp. CBA3647]WAW14164.1 SH3 domain-containing protein [Peptostreptococcus sp. CBA3647]